MLGSVQDEAHFRAKNEGGEIYRVGASPDIGLKTQVVGLKTLENVGKFTKDYVKLTKIGTQRLKKYAQCWKVLEGFCQVAKNR